MSLLPSTNQPPIGDVSVLWALDSPGQRFLEESGIVEAEAENFPGSKVADFPDREDEDSAYPPARLGDRFVAFALDCVVLAGVFAIADAWAIMRWGFVVGAELRLTAAALLIVVLLDF